MQERDRKDREQIRQTKERQTMTDENEEEYLGDGAYARLDSRGWVVIYTSNGIHTTNEVVLEPDVLHAFERWLANLREKRMREAEAAG